MTISYPPHMFRCVTTSDLPTDAGKSHIVCVCRTIKPIGKTAPCFAVQDRRTISTCFQIINIRLSGRPIDSGRMRVSKNNIIFYTRGNLVESFIFDVVRCKWLKRLDCANNDCIFSTFYLILEASQFS